MSKVLKYIMDKNVGIDKVKFVLLGTAFQIYKRATGKPLKRNLFNGKKLFLFPHCNVSSMFAYTEIPDREEIELLRTLIKSSEKSHFLDIGANIGSYSVCMMDLCQKIDAFEPHPFTATRTKKNFSLNGFDEKCVHQVALSNQSGKTHFSDLGHSSSENRITDSGGIEVEMTTLDDFIEKSKFSIEDEYVLKVDVEGFEKEIFEGASKFLTNFKIKGIVFECFNEDKVFSVLNSNGFKSIKKLSENNYLATKNSLG